MRLGTIAFLVGILLFHTLPVIPSRWGCLGLFAIGVLILRVSPIRWLGWGMMGLLWAVLRTPVGQHLQLPAELEMTDLWAEGWVSPFPEAFSRGVRFPFEVAALSSEGRSVPLQGKIDLAWYDPPPETLRVGDKWRFAVRLKRPRGLANPGGFDYERWLFGEGIVARGYVRRNPEPTLLARADRYPVNRLRQAIAEDFQRLLPESPYGGILTALAVGDRQGISSAQWELFTRTGTGHLMAISGLHIGLVGAFAVLLGRWGWGLLPGLAGRWPAAKAGAIAALLGAGGYALMAGLSLPTLRALVMIATVILAVVWQRPLVPSRTLSLALLLVLVMDPAAPLAGGFWLSFGAVATILYLSIARPGRLAVPGRWVRLQLGIGLALLPVTLTLFQNVSLIAPLANLIAIPWASTTVVPLTLLAVLAGFISQIVEAELLQLAALAMSGLWRVLVWLGNTPGGLWSGPAPPLWTMLVALPGLLLLTAPRGLPGRYAGAVLCLPLLFYPIARPAPGEAWFTLLDVGQGLAAVVRTAGHVLVYDTGPRLGQRLDAGAAVLVPFLRQQGVKQVDALVVSHADRQHSGGVRSLLERFSVHEVLTSSPREVPIRGAVPCRAGKTWVWDGVRVRILHPPAGTGFAGDDASCVLLVEATGGRVLLTGDIGPPAEAALVRSLGPSLRAEVLIAPHHGSRSPAKPDFLAAVQPRYVLFSTGYRNRFGYPTAETMRHYGKHGASLLDTAHAGAITFRLGAGETPLTPELYRRQARRHWHVP